MTPACMGGWCKSRDKCAEYHKRSAAKPVERKCGDVEAAVPMRLAFPKWKPAKQMEAA